MTGGAAQIAKGPILARIDELSKQLGDYGVVREAVAELRFCEHKSLLEIGVKCGFVDDEWQERHLREDWFDAANGWWPDLQPIEPVVRQAFLRAGELARTHGCPLDCYWIRTAARRFEVALCRSERQVTVFLLTPEPPVASEACADAREPIQVFRRTAPAEGDTVL